MTEPFQVIKDTDLPPAVAQQPSAALMVSGANGQAQRVAPCLFVTDATKGPATEAQLAEAKLVLLGAIVRWTQSGASNAQQQSAGPYSLGTIPQKSTGYRLWPSEIEQLQEICSGGGSSDRKAFALDTAPATSLSDHLPWCDLMFLGSSCSCGADIAGYPIYERR